MSLGWSRRAPVETLVSTETAIDFKIPFAELPRVSHELLGKDGEASGHVRFSKAQGRAVADLEVSAEPEVVCQRCMMPMRWPVSVRSRIALVSDYDAADRVPEEFEVFLVEADSVSVRDLVDEEVMLALPHVARHSDENECAGRDLLLPGQEAEAPEEAAAAQVQKPFAQLGELLKRK
jgi:uncharacterized protein